MLNSLLWILPNTWQETDHRQSHRRLRGDLLTAFLIGYVPLSSNGEQGRSQREELNTNSQANLSCSCPSNTYRHTTVSLVLNFSHPLQFSLRSRWTQLSCLSVPSPLTSPLSESPALWLPLGSCPPKAAYSQAHQRTGSANQALNNLQMCRWPLCKTPSGSCVCKQLEHEAFILQLWCHHYASFPLFLSSIPRLGNKHMGGGREKEFSFCLSLSVSSSTFVLFLFFFFSSFFFGTYGYWQSFKNINNNVISSDQHTPGDWLGSLVYSKQ